MGRELKIKNKESSGVSSFKVINGNAHVVRHGSLFVEKMANVVVSDPFWNKGAANLTLTVRNFEIEIEASPSEWANLKSPKGGAKKTNVLERAFDSAAKFVASYCKKCGG